MTWLTSALEEKTDIKKLKETLKTRRKAKRKPATKDEQASAQKKSASLTFSMQPATTEIKVSMKPSPAASKPIKKKKKRPASDLGTSNMTVHTFPPSASAEFTAPPSANTAPSVPPTHKYTPAAERESLPKEKPSTSIAEVSSSAMEDITVFPSYVQSKLQSIITCDNDDPTKIPSDVVIRRAREKRERLRRLGRYDIKDL